MEANAEKKQQLLIWARMAQMFGLFLGFKDILVFFWIQTRLQSIIVYILLCHGHRMA